MPGVLWKQHFGPKDAPNTLSYQLEIKLVPAGPGDKPGDVTVPKP